MPTSQDFVECLEYFWLFQDVQDIFDMYYDEDAPQISEEGFEEANDIAEEAWNRFGEKAEKLRRYAMKGKICKDGWLSIERAGQIKEQKCPYQLEAGRCERCGDWCPKFREPEKVPSGEIQLGICGTILYFSEFEDLRGEQ